MRKRTRNLLLSIVVLCSLLFCGTLGYIEYGEIVGFEYTGKIVNIVGRSSQYEDPYFIVTFDPASTVQEARFDVSFYYKKCKIGDTMVYRMKTNRDTQIESCKSP